MEEKWKTIKGYEDCYLISSFGRVMSLKRQGVSDTHILSQKINNKGYAYCELWKEGKGKTFLIHRLVAMHFLNNPKDFSCDVNHKDENPLNNNVKNLEWCSHLYNVRYSSALHPRRKRKSKYNDPIEQIDANGNVVKKYDSPLQCAKENHFNESSILRCCRGERKTAYGFKWRYSR